MKASTKHPKQGFSLIEVMAGVFIMATVITAGLAGLSQSQRISSKSQSLAYGNLILRAEVEEIRTMTWSEIETFYKAIKDYESANNTTYSTLASKSSSDAGTSNLATQIKAEQLSGATEIGKIIFHVTVSWDDLGGKSREESRVFVVTEGGISA